MEFIEIDLALICPSPTNPRKSFPAEEMAEMIDSVKRHGVLQPILVRPWPAAYPFEGERAPAYELIAGERRYRATTGAQLDTIPAMVRDLDDHEVLEIQIIENLQRKGLNELEEAEGYELMTKQYGYSAEQLAEKIGKSKAYIYARLKLTAAGEAARKAFREGELDASRLLLISRIPTAALQESALSDLLTRPYLGTFRNAAQHVQDRYMLKLAQAPFSRSDAELVPAAGKCHPCPKRTGSTPELYPDVKSADICTDPDCYAAKKAKERSAQAKTETEIRQRIHAQIRTAYAADLLTPTLQPEYMALVARQFFAQTWGESQTRLARLWAPSDEKLSDSECVTRLASQIDTLPPHQLCLLLLDLALIGTTQCHTYDSLETPAPLLATARRLDVPIEAIRREAQGITPPFAVGDYVRVAAYPCNKALVGSLGQVTQMSTAIASGKPVYQIALTDGVITIAQDEELAPSTAEAFAAQQEERNPANEAPAATRAAYAHPENSDLTWTGRGRKPKWVDAWLAEGGSLDELASPQRCDKTMELPGVTTPALQPAA